LNLGTEQRVEVEKRFREGLPVLEYVLQLMGRRMGHLASDDDMREHARNALLDAAQTYDPSRASLPTYVSRKIRWAILDGIKRDRRSRKAIARATGLLASERLSEGLQQTHVETGALSDDTDSHLDRLLEAHAAALTLGLIAGGNEFVGGPESPEAQASLSELTLKMHRAIETLPERERVLIERHYFDGEEFEEIALSLSISKSWASRLHALAIQRLAVAMKEACEP